jgi:hypothetical protein
MTLLLAAGYPRQRAERVFEQGGVLGHPLAGRGFARRGGDRGVPTQWVARSGCPNNCRRSEAEKDSPCSKLHGIRKLNAAPSFTFTGNCGGRPAHVDKRCPGVRLCEGKYDPPKRGPGRPQRIGNVVKRGRQGPERTTMSGRGARPCRNGWRRRDRDIEA